MFDKKRFIVIDRVRVLQRCLCLFQFSVRHWSDINSLVRLRARVYRWLVWVRVALPQYVIRLLLDFGLTYLCSALGF